MICMQSFAQFYEKFQDGVNVRLTTEIKLYTIICVKNCVFIIK